MTLPSQFARTTTRHQYTFRRRRGSRRIFLGMLAVVLIVAFGLWRVVGGGDSPESALAIAGETAGPTSTQDDVALYDLPANRPLARDAQPRTSASTSPAEEPPPPAPAPEKTQQQSQAAEQPRENEIRMGESLPENVTSPSRVRITETPRETTATPERPQPEETKPASSTTTSAPPSRPAPTPAQQRAHDRVRIGMELLASNRPIEGRVALTRALDSGTLDAATARQVRETLGELNERLVFSPEIVEGDPFSFGYTIRPGDALSRLPRSQNLAADWRLIQRVNRIVRPEAIRAGQRLKLVTGPFHAVVYKRQFRMDIYMGDGADRVFVRSFSVGLGEYDSTPVGMFEVRANSKLINPEWVNPRTGQRFLPDDPTNPIGEHWIGLVGVSEGVRDLGGYGIHGTIEPETIGQQASMGCIRMHADDVELVYELLVEQHSTIEIVDR